jgi:hypothetical protein
VDARRALSNLIEADALAAEAQRRGLGDDPEVRAAANRELARQYLRSTFETDVSPASIGDTELRKAYLRVRARLDHPDVRVVRHILARTAKGDGDARKAELRQRLEKVHAAAVSRALHDPEAFVALAQEFSDAKVRLEAEQYATARRYWSDENFAAATFALEKIGDVSPVVESQFGFHVILYEAFSAEERISFEQARDKLRENLWPDFQRREFGGFMDTLMLRHKVQVYAARLDDLQAGGEQGGAEPTPAGAAQ